MNHFGALDSADVVVVGAGISGLATAYELRLKGFDVIVVEQRFPAFGASGRHAGAVWMQLRRTGLEMELARAGQRKYAEYISEFGNTFRYRQNGGLFFFNTDEQAAVLTEYVKDREQAGLEMQILDRKQAKEIAPILPDDAIGGVYCTDDAQVDPQLLVSTLAAACSRLGVRKYDNTAVLSAVRSGARVSGVRTVRGDIHTSAVVWATGAWAVNLQTESIDLPIQTVRQGQLVTQPIAVADTPILHGPRGVDHCGALLDLPGFKPELFSSDRTRADNVLVGYDDTISQNAEGAIYVGSSLDAYGSLNPHVGIAATEAMISLLHRRYPEYPDLGITGLWAGLGVETADGLPIIDRFEQSYVNCGHSWGLGSSLIGGQITAELIAGETNRFTEALKVSRPSLRADKLTSDSMARN